MTEKKPPSFQNQRIWWPTLYKLRKLTWILNKTQPEVMDMLVTAALDQQPEDMRQLAEERFPDPSTSSGSDGG